MGKTKVAWSNMSWNPVVGCTKVSAGCLNCYAEKMAYRLACMGQKKYEAVISTDGGVWNHKAFCDIDKLEQPLHWRKPCKVFVCSMGDLCHKAVPSGFQDKVLDVIRQCPHHIFQILTKREIELRNMIKKFYFTNKIKTLLNLWLGVTAENQKTADERIPILLQIPAAVRFVSCEPLLDHIKLGNYVGCKMCPYIGCSRSGKYIDWIIIGCESIGGRAGRFRNEFADAARDIIRQCDAAGVPVFVKQIPINGKVSHDPAEWPEDLRQREYPLEAEK